MCDDVSGISATSFTDTVGGLAIMAFPPFMVLLGVGFVVAHIVLLAELAGGIAAAAGLVLGGAVAISRRANRAVLVDATPSFRARLAAAEQPRALPRARRRAITRPRPRAIPAPARVLEGVVVAGPTTTDPAGRRVYSRPTN